MNDFLRISAALLAATSVTLGTAAAQTGPDTEAAQQKPYPKFEEVDANGDGKVTWKEAKAAGIPKAEFESADFDEDGELTRVGYRYSLNQRG